MPSNKKFGYMILLVNAMYIVFIIISGYNIITVSLCISIFVLLIFIVIFKSEYLGKINYYWYIFGKFLHKIISPIIMLIIFSFMVVPVGMIGKLFGRDLLNLSDSKKNTYWIRCNNKSSKPINFENEF
jgi:hypothetical protein